jgi:N-acetyl-beta-hexosaminidase
MIDTIGSENLELIHLGADEVFNIASCAKCKFISEEIGHIGLFSAFIKKILTKVKKSHPNLEVIIWDDMFRNANH